MRIMIVDDEPKIRQGLRALLTGQEGMEVVGAYESAISALLAISEKNPDVLITDIRMPECNGLDFIEKIREKDERIKIIILSGYSEFSYAQRAIKYGVYRYLTKPTNPRELLMALRELGFNTRKNDGEAVGKNVFSENFEVGNYLVREAMNYIEVHYAEKIGLKSIADVLHISPNYLSDLFRLHLKDNFSDYLLAFRLKKACLFLELPQYKVSDVSQMVGFKDATYFSTVFKKAYNATPLEYKNTAKKLHK